MAQFKIEYKNNDIVFYHHDKVVGSSAPNADDFEQFKEWIISYNQILEEFEHQVTLLNLGQKIYAWLDAKQGFIESMQEQAEPPFILEFQIPKKATATQKAFIEVPWELLADDSGHLAKDSSLNFSPVRRIGNISQTPNTPSSYRLSTVFMAASPKNVKPELAFEAEESAILNLGGAENLDMDLFVEESGNLQQLVHLVADLKSLAQEKLTEQNPIDIIHISCHGNIAQQAADQSNQAYLALEDNTGELCQISADFFARIFSQNRPRLTFISACKTAQAHLSQQDNTRLENFSSFSQDMVAQKF